MAPSVPGSSPGAAPLPPLPVLSGGGQGAASGQSGLASIMSRVAPVKASVDTIVQEAKKIVQSGAVPGAEQVCSQLVALATSLLPMALQSSMAPGPMQSPQGATGPVGPVGGPPPGGPPQGGPPQGQ